MVEGTSDDRHETRKVVPVEFPEGVVAAYANNLTAQRDGRMILLLFSQVTPPIIIGTEEEKQKQIEELRSVKALPVARVAIPVQVVPGMLRVIEDQLQRALSESTSPDVPVHSDNS